MLAQAFNSSTQEAERSKRISFSEFEAGLVYIVSSKFQANLHSTVIEILKKQERNKIKSKPTQYRRKKN